MSKLSPETKTRAIHEPEHVEVAAAESPPTTFKMEKVVKTTSLLHKFWKRKNSIPLHSTSISGASSAVDLLSSAQSTSRIPWLQHKKIDCITPLSRCRIQEVKNIQWIASSIHWSLPSAEYKCNPPVSFCSIVEYARNVCGRTRCERNHRCICLFPGLIAPSFDSSYVSIHCCTDCCKTFVSQHPSSLTHEATVPNHAHERFLIFSHSNLTGTFII